MSYDYPFPRHVAEYKFDGENRLLKAHQFARANGSFETEDIGSPDPEPPLSRSSTTMRRGSSS